MREEREDDFETQLVRAAMRYRRERRRVKIIKTSRKEEKRLYSRGGEHEAHSSSASHIFPGIWVCGIRLQISLQRKPFQVEMVFEKE